MPFPTASWLGKIPSVRLVLCLICGIGLQWKIQFDLFYLCSALAVSTIAIIVYTFLPVALKYRFFYSGGVVISVFIAICGSILVWVNDVRHDPLWIGQQNKTTFLFVTIEEDPVEKANSYKALASVQSAIKGDSIYKNNGKLILYFKKDSINAQLHYGSQLLFDKPVQEIRNSGNPGSFDYKRYCLFKGITHQVYLAGNDYRVHSKEKKNWFNAFVFQCNQWVIGTLRKFIHGEKERGLAEALLIGYKDDLDRDLVSAYSTTGVVHVIAISGLHLGLIYWLLLLLTKPLQRKKQTQWLRFIILLSALWLFSIMAGAQPSVLRSAVMFSFIALGEVIERKGSVFNTLAFSAFVLLCYNPFWLWDIGFQLSYAAVLSILLFFKPVYNWFYFENKLLDFVWKLNAVTISAQLLTLPVSVYHFHQLPTLFLFTNLVAVPLSSLILFAEILLCVLFFAEPIAGVLGRIIQWMIWCMNSYITRWAGISFSAWKDLSISGIQALLLTAFILFICFWLMENKRSLLRLSLASIFLFTILRSVSFIKADRQKKLIVYNIPKHQAIDLIHGRSALFIGDPDLLTNESLKNFHLRPARIGNRTSKINDTLIKSFEFLGRRILVIDSSIKFIPAGNRQVVDVLVLSKNPKFYISDFVKNFEVRQIVIDGSVPAWKSVLWKKDCDSLRIPCQLVSEEGAYEINL